MELLMGYESFLLSKLFSTYCTEYANMDNYDQFKSTPKIWDEFENSEYYDKYDDIEVNLIAWLDSIEWSYWVECDCGHWETMPADMPRHKIQTLEWLKNSDLDATAYYKCFDCGETVRSEIVPDFDIDVD